MKGGCAQEIQNNNNKTLSRINIIVAHQIYQSYQFLSWISHLLL